MFQSKALKYDEEKISWRKKLYWWWIETSLSKFYYKWIRILVKNPTYQIKRLIEWYWNVFRFDYDFDGHCLFAIIEYKLKRLQKVLLNGHAVQELKDLKALRLAIKLAGRLKAEEYSHRFHERHESKFGKKEYWFTPQQDSDYLTMHTQQENAVFEKDKKRARKEFISGLTLADATERREQKWLFDILNKYLRNLWD